MVAGFDEQVADAAGAERLTNQADRSMGQFLERAGLLTDASQFVECVEPVAERSLGGGPVEQLGAQPEVGQRDAADARDRLEKVDVVLFAARRLRPFEVEHAGLSYQVLTENKIECKVLAAVIPGPILQEYEAAVRAAGYEPGAVLPSSLAALAGLASMEAVLAANLSGPALTTTITSGQDLLLYRTLDLPEDPALRLDEVRRGIAVAAAFYEDKLSTRPRMLYYAGDGGAGEFARWIDDLELAVVELAPRPEIGAATTLGGLSIAGVTGALAGVS